MKSPVTTAQETIDMCNIMLEVSNTLMVAKIRASVYWDRIAAGWSPDKDAAMFLHINGSNFGSQQSLETTRKNIVDALEQRYTAQYIKNNFLDAMHAAQHEVLGECMYTVDWDDVTETEILSQPCSYWTDAPVRR